MTTPTPDELADDIEAAIARQDDASALLYAAEDKAMAAMKTAADALAAAASALDAATIAHGRETIITSRSLLDTAAIVRDLAVAQPPAWTPRFAGDCPPGTIRLGVTYGSNTDPGNRYGSTIGCRRTFASDWGKRNTLIGYAKADHANGILPFISTKIDVKALASGNATVLTELGAFITELRNLVKPVVAGFFHEPEDNIAAGEFTGGAFRASQVAIRQAITKAGATNVAFATPLMSYTFKAASGRNPADYWPGDGVWDALAVDAYSKDVTWAEVPAMEEWKNLTAFAASKGLPVIVGEWGQRGNDATSVAKMRKAYDAFIAQGVPIVAWFDTSLNSGYPLSDPMLTAFRALAADPRSVTLTEQPGVNR